MGYNRNLDRQNAVSYTWLQRNGPSLIGGIIIILFAAIYVFTYLPKANAENVLSPSETIIESIYWSDGDSGHITFTSGETIAFRLNDRDAPETGGVGAAIGGAQCEKERELGFASKGWVVEYTRGAELKITGDYGADRYDRKIIDLSANGIDVGDAGISLGHYRSWKHEGKKSLEPRPDWCEGS